MKTLMILALVLCSGCSLIDKAQRTLDQANEALEKVNVKLDDVDSVVDNFVAGAAQLGEEGRSMVEKAREIREHLHRADTDESGTLSGWEIILALGGLLGVGGGVGVVSKKSGERQAKQQEVEARVARLEAAKPGS